MLYLDKYSIRRLMEGREHPHFVWSTITANLFVYAQALERFFFKFPGKNAGFLREVTVKKRHVVEGVSNTYAYTLRYELRG
jgi:hypothetical protein